MQAPADSKSEKHPLILNGEVLLDSFTVKMMKAVKASGRKPALAILQVGNRVESNAYIARKKNFAEAIGASVKYIKFPETAEEEKLLAEIHKLNEDGFVHGIIVQLPIPNRFDRRKIIDAILPKKDVDGLTSENKRRRRQGDRKAVVGATAKGVLSLLKSYGISVRGKRAAVIGRSELVGEPIAELLAREGASVTVCHRGTKNIPAITREADIIISAAGAPRLVTKEFVSRGQVVVDVGINSVSGEKFEEEVPKRRIVGDVDFESVKDIASAISPVPGGVGPMTVLSLFQNLLDAAGIGYNN